MPPNRHLGWTEIKDFTPGLFSADNFSIPLGGAQELTNYYPLPQGGLRAWYAKSSTLSTTGIDDVTAERVVGIFVRGGIAKRATSGTAPDRYLITFNVSDMKHRVYRMDETNGVSTWSKIKTSTAATQTTSLMHLIRFFHTSAGDDLVVFTIGSSGSTDAGIWTTDYATVAPTPVKRATYAGPFTIHQARIVVAEGGATNPSAIHWTEPGDVTSFPADNELDVDPNQVGELIRMLEAFAPGDLLIAKSGAPWVNLQGDIEDPTTFQMGGSQTLGLDSQQGVIVPAGIVFMEPDGYLWLTSNGGDFKNLSAPLARFTELPGLLAVGKPDYFDHWLFAPDGHVYDWETGAWFQASDIKNLAAWYSVDRTTRKLMAATEGTSFSLFEYDVSQGATRANVGTFRTGPLRSPDGRQIEIREIQVPLTSHAASSSIDVTVNGTTHSATGIATGTETVSLLFVEREEMLDVKVVGTGGSGGQAPTIEAVRIGHRSGHLTT